MKPEFAKLLTNALSFTILKKLSKIMYVSKKLKNPAAFILHFLQIKKQICSLDKIGLKLLKFLILKNIQ